MASLLPQQYSYTLKMTKYIVVPNQLYYHGDSLTVPYYYHTEATKLAETTTENRHSGFFSVGAVKAVACSSLAEGVDILAKDIGTKLQAWFGWNPSYFSNKTFTFSIVYSEITDGRFWLTPSTSDCKDHPIQL